MSCKGDYIMDYKDFLRTKEFEYQNSGFDIPIDKLNNKLFVTVYSFSKKRYMLYLS